MNHARAFCFEYRPAMRLGAGSCHADIRRHLVDELADIERRIKAVMGKVEAYASQHDAVSRLVTIPGIGVLCATAIVAAAGEGRQSRKAHDLHTWLVPAEHSTGGRQTLPGISKRGNRYVRRLITHGARSCFVHLSRADRALSGGLLALEARKRTPLPMPKGDRSGSLSRLGRSAMTPALRRYWVTFRKQAGCSPIEVMIPIGSERH